MNAKIIPATKSAIKRNLTTIVQNISQRFGFVIRRASGFYEACYDIGRDYEDKEGTLPRFILKKEAPKPWSGNIVTFKIDNGESVLEETIYYSHLSLLKLCKDFSFNSILDIGSHEGKSARIFKHLGKEVTTVEIAPGYEADYKADYLYQKFNKKFDAIWCSQIYEHQRNPGIFLDKLFDDLNDGGVLALTVPFQIDHNVMFGHLNLTSPLMLIYHLVCAGFDCKDICLKCYNGSIGVILRKKDNGIKRGLSMGALPVISATTIENLDKLGDEFFQGMKKAFPEVLQNEVETNFLSQKVVSINWGDPL